MDLSIIITVLGFLTVVTNIVTEVLKKITYSFIPTEILTVIVSQFLTVFSYVLYCKYSAIDVTWYNNISAVVVGFLVSYGAMFGFDKLKEAIEKINNKK